MLDRRGSDGRRLSAARWPAICAAAGLGFWHAAPLLAQEGGAAGGGGSSYAGRFLHTDNPLGTGLIWLCLLVSVAIVSLILQNALRNRRSAYTPPALSEEIERLIAEKKFREAIEAANADPSPFGQVMGAALAEAPRGYHAMEEAMEPTAEDVANRRVRSLIWLEVAGAAGPMIGLFGTVFGMILSFQKLVSLGGAPKPAELAGGIGTALVCTFWGLVVGIPGVICASIFRVQIEGRSAEAVARAKHLLATFRPGGRPKASAPAAGATPRGVPA